MLRNVLNCMLLISVAALIWACGDFFAKKPLTETELKLSAEGDLGFRAVLSNKTDVDQTLSTEVDSVLLGSGAVFPGGSVGETMTVLIEQGVELATPLLYDRLGLIVDEFVVGQSVYINADRPEGLRGPFVLHLPLPASGDSGDVLALLYRSYKDSSQEVLVEGLVGSELLRVDAQFAEYSTTRFGLYQLIRVDSTQLDKARSGDHETDFKILSASASADLGTVSWNIAHDANTATQRLGKYSVELDVKVERCVGFVHKSQESGWHKTIRFTSFGDIRLLPDNAEEHTLDLRFECLDSFGRGLLSPWAETYPFRATVLDLIGYTDQNELPDLSLMAGGYGAEYYRYLVFDTPESCDDVVFGPWISVSEPLELSFPERKGNVSLCLQIKDAVGFVSMTERFEWHQGIQGPEWEVELEDFSWPEDEPIELTVTASDRETTDPVVYGLDQTQSTCAQSDFDPRLSIDSVTGVITGTPRDDAVGECSIVPTFSSMGFTRSYEFVVEITNTPDEPEWVGRGDEGRTVEAGTAFSFTVRALDPDPGESVSFVVDLSSGSCEQLGFTDPIAVDSSSGKVTGTPAASASGTCEFIVSATSGSDSITKPVRLTVEALEEE